MPFQSQSGEFQTLPRRQLCQFHNVSESNCLPIPCPRQEIQGFLLEIQQLLVESHTIVVHLQWQAKLEGQLWHHWTTNQHAACHKIVRLLGGKQILENTHRYNILPSVRPSKARRGPGGGQRSHHRDDPPAQRRAPGGGRAADLHRGGNTGASTIVVRSDAVFVVSATRRIF